MSLLALSLKNIFTMPTLSFAGGIFLYRAWPLIIRGAKFSGYLSAFILFSLGVKAGSSLITSQMPSLLGLVFFGLLAGFTMPFLAFYLLRRFTGLDVATAAVLGSCFGSMSVMTLVLGVSFLESQSIAYSAGVIGLSAVMDLPAIFSAIYLVKKYARTSSGPDLGFQSAILKSVRQVPVLALLMGLSLGALLEFFGLIHWMSAIFLLWSPSLAVFLLFMGIKVSEKIYNKTAISKSVLAFGIYMPIIGALLSFVVSWILHLDPGTAVLFALLIASASYIGIPAVMQKIMPDADAGVYVFLALAVTFPFNVSIGIPLYTLMARGILGP